MSDWVAFWIIVWFVIWVVLTYVAINRRVRCWYCGGIAEHANHCPLKKIYEN